MVDAVNLIHMGGRIYDPELGRFLSPDPNVPDPHNTQAYNRYSYVYNNPLSYSDPSGFVPMRESPDMTEEEMDEAERKMTEEQKKELEERTSNGDTVTVVVRYDDGTTGTVTYRPSESTDAVQGSGSGDVVLTDEQEAIVGHLTEAPFDSGNDTEAYQLIRRDNVVTKRSTKKCTETTCPAFDAEVEIHWHVKSSIIPSGTDELTVNLAREFPGPGDSMLVGYDVVNVGVTPTGGVWAIEKKNGETQLRYLRSSSNPRVDKFVQDHWHPGMNERQMLRVIDRRWR